MECAPELRSESAMATTANFVILEGGSRGWISLNAFDPQALPLNVEVADAANMHSSAFPTCVSVPTTARYRIMAAVVFMLDEFGDREVFISVTPPGGTTRVISDRFDVTPNQTEQTRLAVFASDWLIAGDCVELNARALNHGASVGSLGALAVGFALW